MDVLAVRQACKFAKDWVTAEKGPLILEMVTYRYGGHSMSDPGTTYRTREEISLMRSSKDPITGLRQRILDHNLASDAELKQIEKDARSYMEEEKQKALKDDFPSPSELYTDVYLKGSEGKFLRGREREEITYFQ